MTGRAPVNAPPAGPPRVGLLVSARDPLSNPSSPADRNGDWRNGFAYDPELCSTGYITSACNPGANDRALGATPADVEWDPYVIGAGVKCSTFGHRARDWPGQARRALQAVAEFQVSRELWTGVQAAAEGLPNRFLADVDNVDILTEEGAVGLTHGLACLEQYLSDCNAGQRGMIHATWQVVTHWMRFGLIERSGSLLTTVHDTIVVPGAGYDGTDPNGNVGDGNVWAYATGMVDVRRDSDVDLFGLPEDTIDRNLNDVEVRAEQLAVASWDGCCHAGIRLDVETCDVGGS